MVPRAYCQIHVIRDIWWNHSISPLRYSGEARLYFRNLYLCPRTFAWLAVDPHPVFVAKEHFNRSFTLLTPMPDPTG